MRMRASPTSPRVGPGPGGPPEGNAIALSGGGLQGLPKGRKVNVERREATWLSPNESTQDGPGAEGIKPSRERGRAASGTPLDTARRETRLALRTVQAVLPHTALQSVVSSSGSARQRMGFV